MLHIALSFFTLLALFEPIPNFPNQFIIAPKRVTKPFQIGLTPTWKRIKRKNFTHNLGLVLQMTHICYKS
jgi:hypothetical protein